MLKVSSLTSTQATLVGLFAPICWGMSVSLVRGIAEGFGMAQGQFFLYCVATTCVFFIVGLPDFHRIDKRYLYFDGSRYGQLFVAVTHNSLCCAL